MYKLQWYPYIFIPENALEDVVCKMAVIFVSAPVISLYMLMYQIVWCGTMILTKPFPGGMVITSDTRLCADLPHKK